MDDIYDGGPAFPAPAGAAHITTGGMTLRDYFAAMAMQGMLSDLPKPLYGENWIENVANASYEVAEAMLKARGA